MALSFTSLHALGLYATRSSHEKAVKYKYKYNSYFHCAPYSLTDGALQKSCLPVSARLSNV